MFTKKKMTKLTCGFLHFNLQKCLVLKYVDTKKCLYEV